MPSQREKRRMMDFTLDCLDSSGEDVNPTSGNTRGININYIKVGDDGIVLMVDKAFGEEKFKSIYRDIQGQFDRVGILFFKDRKTFFRSAAERNYFKKSNELSLKKYNNEDMHRMMLLRPEEIKVNSNSSHL